MIPGWALRSARHFILHPLAGLIHSPFIPSPHHRDLVSPCEELPSLNDPQSLDSLDLWTTFHPTSSSPNGTLFFCPQQDLNHLVSGPPLSIPPPRHILLSSTGPYSPSLWTIILRSSTGPHPPGLRTTVPVSPSDHQSSSPDLAIFESVGDVP